MHRAIPDYLECLLISSAREHGGCISADEHGLAGEKAMMVIKVEVVWMPRDTAVIDSNLTVILADIL